jgi:preprotein translocase subunit SecA
MISSILQKIFGTQNDKELKKYKKIVTQINELEPTYESMSDEELQEAFLALKESVTSGQKHLSDVLVESFAMTREASKRALNMRHYDVQLIGGMVLNDSKIAEMKTGEGKTLVATLAVVLNAMVAKGVHVVTVNDYLASRDAEEMKPLYNFLGFSVGVITGDMHDDADRIKAYECDITYGTNNEYGFDYLRDNLKYSLEEVAQKNHYYAIVDEVDSILIDEARTPLIISGPTNHKMEHYIQSNDVALALENEKHFSIDEKNKTIVLTEEGIKRAEELYEVENLYELDNAKLAHHLDQALKANYLFEIDKDYVVKDNEVIIVDEFTGRLSEGRRFSEGLHQALEAKESVEIQEESQTVADITFQNYFRLYDKLAGMTGTAQTEATEFAQIYSLDVISIPTNVAVERKDLNDLIYKTEREKFDAVINKIKLLNKKGQPVLVGTASIERSEALHKLLKTAKIPHTVLNAKQHEKEANIILDAGKKGAVTIATNMAGRGVDIKIDDEVRALGGLAIIGTERHESRRIDNQLRGRSGRQGDPGESQFYLSLEDNLLRIFGSDKIKGIMERLGIEEGEHIESKMVTRAVENAQKKVEGMHFESRKNLLEYDDVANEQRKVIYNFRRNLLNPDYNISEKIEANRVEYVADLLARCEIYDGMPSEDYNTSKIVALLKEEMNEDFDSLDGLDYTELNDKIITTLMTNYTEKLAIANEEFRRYIEQTLYLQVVDNSWREHLYQMDILKAGIHLRGYNQKDPLVEYKKESYNMFIELTDRIKFESLKDLHLIQITTAEDEEQRAQQMRAQMEQEAMADISMTHLDPNAEPEEKTVVEKKIPRNDPCPCGSGKKYKQCCGKSGPKKGLVANN